MDSFRLEVPITVRFRDIDSMGHVNNAVYFTYCEIARNTYWTGLFGPRNAARPAFIMARAEIDYRSPAGEGDTLLAGIRVASLGGSSFEFQYRIVVDGTRRIVAEGRSVQVGFDYRAGHKVPLSDPVRKSILAFESPETVAIRDKSSGG